MTRAERDIDDSTIGDWSLHLQAKAGEIHVKQVLHTSRSCILLLLNLNIYCLHPVVSVLAPPMVDKFMPMLEKEADYLIERLVADPNGIDPRQALQVMTMNAVLLTCFGVRATSVDDPLFQEIANYVDESLAVGGLQGDVTEFLPILKFFDKFGQRTKKRKVQLALLEKRNAIFERLIKQALDSKKDCFVRHFYNILEEHELDDRDVVVTMSKCNQLGCNHDYLHAWYV